MGFRVVARELLWCLEWLLGSCYGVWSFWWEVAQVIIPSVFSRVVARELLWYLEWLLGSCYGI